MEEKKTDKKVRKLKQEVEKLAKEVGYDRISLSLALDKRITLEHVLEDVKALLQAEKTGKGFTTIYETK